MKHLHCAVFGHNYAVSKTVTNFVKEYKCSYCDKQWTTNNNGNIIPLTAKFKEINSVLSRIHNKKLSKRTLILDR